MEEPTNVTDSYLKSPQITAQLPKLTRDVLAGIEKRGWVKGSTDRYGESRVTIRYSPDEVRKLNLMHRCYEAGLTTDQIEKILHAPETFFPLDSTAFGQAVSRLLQDVLDDDPKALTRIVVTEAVKVLRAECILLFLEPETWPGRLKLAAGCVYAGSFDQVHDVDPGNAYADWLAQGMELPPPDVESAISGTPRAAWRELRIQDVQNKFISDFAGFPRPVHLPSGEYYSWLCLPLADRKRRLFGYLVAENRLGPKGKPGRAVSFDTATEHIGKTYAAFLSRILQIVPLVMTQERLLAQSLRFRPLDEFLKQVVRIGILLTRGFRGELAVYEQGRGMVIRAQKGPAQHADGKSPLRHLLPNRSVSRYVYETGDPLIIDDVNRSDMYYQCHPATKSQITVPLPLPFSDRRYGTLTIEAHREKGFDATDKLNLEQLAAQAGSYANTVEQNAAITELLSRFYQTSDRPEGRTGPLWTILEEVYRATGFTSGIVYLADYRAARLTIVGTRQCPKIAPDKLSRMWRFVDRSFATKVFLEQRPYFAEDPSNNVFVNRRGLEAFGVRGPLLGVPITFQHFIVGVLVVWSEGTPQPKETDWERLRPFTELLVASARTREEPSIRAQTMNTLARVQALIRSNFPKDEVFREILNSLLIRFDRAKIHQYRNDPHDQKGPYFECLQSVGDTQPDRYKTQKVYCSQSPYLNYIVNTLVKEAVPDVFPNDVLGPDPCAYMWDRRPDQEWAMTSLYARGNLWGYLAVDNGPSMRPLDHSESKELIALYGWLSELAIAAARPTEEA